MNPQGPPLPTRQVMSQWWRDISFLHWRVDPDVVAPLLPRGVHPDVHDGSSWVGLIPFRMVDAGLGKRGPVPRLGTFYETNVRVYSVDDAGRHGVVFRSLEADRLPVVAAARLGFGVPYQWARLSVEPTDLGPAPEGRTISYRSRRRSRDGAGGRIDIEVGDLIAEPDPLALFLTARFGLHTTVAGRTLWVPNTHGPWPLRSARAVVVEDSLVAAAGLPGLTDSPPESVLFSSGVRTTFGLPQRI
ncbi:DUF2071 domain-containing protein [Nocardioides sp. CN2-186]|uniref:YqjF family protein n=1 Tax=Nocardioides tweenelious TaxID=3156607 RepID=UPI0032B47D4F